METVDKDESPEAAKQSGLVKHWLQELSDAREREKDFRKFAADCVSLYEAEKKEQYQFNILYSNTETLAPALYNALPRPVVQRRHKDEDALGMQAAKVAQRTLEFLLDIDNQEYTSFDEAMQSATLEALVPGRGVTRFKYEAKFDQVTPEGEGQEPYEKVSGELVCPVEVPWDRFLHGYAKKWKDVPWVAFEDFMTRDELIENFGKEIGARVEVTEIDSDDDASEGTKGSRGKETRGVKLACVYQIWDKSRREVISISPGYKDGPLHRVSDPLGLSGFFPCPRPLMMLRKISCLTPTSLYALYEEQAKELNAITVRINKLVRALKVRGFYDSTIEGLDKVLNADDNILIPAENVAALQQGQSLEKSIWLMPLEKLIAVLQQLYLQRNQVKQTIYEITGIADIMRGSSQASETLGAQEIKNQWGTLRLKKAQREVQRYARDCLRIMAEIAVTKFSPETLRAMTGLPFPTKEEQMQAQAVAQQIAATGQQPPEDVVRVLSTPSWDDLLKLLRDDLQRAYRIDIETNSTVDAEATEDKQNVSEFFNALAQFFNGVGPIVQSGAMPFEAAQAMMLAAVRRFRFGPEVEEQLKQMKPPVQPGAEGDAKPDPAAEAASQTALAAEQAKMETLKMEMDLARAEHAFKMEELRMKSMMASAQHQAKMQQLQRAANTPALPARNTPEKSNASV